EISLNRERGADITRGGKRITLSDPSAGEKHEFIMPYNVRFESPENSLLPIDEPEISLHLLWQLEFMPDLRSIESANHSRGIVPTHSPQILQRFDDIVFDLEEQAH